MALDPQGLFLVERLEPLTPAAFTELVARGEPFTLKVDFRGLDPPIEELDLATLVPARASAFPPGTLVLAYDGGFVFRRVGLAGAGPGVAVARVVRVERPGAVVDLESVGWRLLGRLLVMAPGFARLSRGWRSVRSLIDKLLHPLPCPVSLGPPELLMDGVVLKYGDPREVGHRAKRWLEGLEAWEEEFFARVLPAGGRLLLVGCGAGGAALALAERGFTVVAVDPVPALAEVARRSAQAEGIAATFEVRPLAEVAIDSGPFDGVVSLRDYYVHIPTRRRRVATLTRLMRLVAPGGVLVLFAGCYRDRGPRLALVDGLRWAIRGLLGERFATEPGDRLVRHLSLASDARIRCFYHLFQTSAEIRRELDAAGLAAELDPEGAWVARTPA